MADGAPRAIRSIAGQKTGFTRLIHDMTYDPVRDEITVTQASALAILTFKGDADGDVAPIRTIMGPKTELTSVGSGRLALDPVNHEIYLPLGDRVLVYPQLGNGDVAPIRELKGPDTQLAAQGVTVDTVHNLLIVSGGNPDWRGSGAGGGGGEGGGTGLADLIIERYNNNVKPRKGTLEGTSMGQIEIFDRTASGNTKPLRVIKGSKTFLNYSQIIMTTYAPRGWIFGAVWGSSYGEIGESSDRAFVGVWSIYDNGDVPPRWTIGGPNGILQQARGVSVDPRDKTVFVTDKRLGAVFSFEFPELF